MAHEASGGEVATQLTAAPMRPRRQGPSGTPPLEQRLQEGMADAEQGGQSPLRAELLVVGTNDFLSEVERIGCHI
jgi:hypothetical protein